MSEVKKCPRCRGKMIKKSLEIGTSESGVSYWGIYGTEPLAYVCNKCGYIELYDKGRIPRVRARAQKPRRAVNNQFRKTETLHVAAKEQPAKLGKLFCRYCGAENKSDAVFCEKCGKKIAE